MREGLRVHSDSLSSGVSGIEVEIVRRSGTLALHYLMTGLIDDILLPHMSSPRRANGLWKHTCFEAFVRSPGEEAYCELNFAPSGSWAAYRFDSYRTGMLNADLRPPQIDVRTTTDRFELRAEFDLPGGAPWQLALSAVIEEVDGNKSYWALAHPPGDPDFHHPACFALELPAANSP